MGEVSDGGVKQEVTWQTTPVDAVAYWALGIDGLSNLSVSTRLGY